MLKNQKSVRNGIEDFLCPFTDIFITQGPNEQPSHEGTMSMDVRGLEPGVRYPYYAPCTCKLINLYTETNTAVWQSIDRVRLSNGVIDYMTFCTAHDNTFDAKIGQVIPQGSQLGNLGDYSQKGDVTGVHCHIEHSRSWDSERVLNQYGNWHFKYELDPEDVWFMDNTNVISGTGKWKYIKDVPVDEPKQEEPKQEVIVDNTKVKELEEQIKLKDEEIKVLQERVLELTEQRDIVLKNQPTLIYTAPKDITGRIKLKKDEQLYIKKN